MVITIELSTSSVLAVIQTTGYFAPLAFILFHIFRQFLFIPVAVVCVAGGMLFGVELGSIFSIIGLTGASITFYFISKVFPTLIQRFTKMKMKWLGTYTNLSIYQIVLLRMIPLINFSLISLCILEKAKTFRRYVKLSLLTHIPAAFCFTFLGATIQTLSPILVVAIFVLLLVLVYVFREKQALIKWHDFFVREKT